MNINHELKKECDRRIAQFELRTGGLPGPLDDFLNILRLFDERLVELERKK